MSSGKKTIDEFDAATTEDSGEKACRRLADPFSNIDKWKNKKDLAKHLIRNIVYFNPEDKLGLVGKAIHFYFIFLST